MAASCKDILSRCFPILDTEIADYVNSILADCGDDFQRPEDLFEAVGSLLQEGVADKDENDILEICDRLYHVMKEGRDPKASNGPVKILDAPVHLGSLVESNQSAVGDGNSIWLSRRDNSTKVNQKKLGKAEAKLKEKQEKRTQSYSAPATNGNTPELATASQQSNRKFNKMESAGTNRSYDIHIADFDVAFGDKVLMKCADLVMSYGRRYGLVGRNGIGKTTLLKMLSCRELRIPSHISVLHVEQEVVGNDVLALDSVLECDTKRAGLIQEERDINSRLAASSGTDPALNTRLAEVYAELEAAEADKAPAKAGTILAGLGFSPAMQRAATRTFSGGWRMRLALARALFSKPDLLLLDEPTNMLDMKAIIWLEDYLQSWPSTILVVSHDRQFLNMVVSDVIHLQSQKLDPYKGDFETFVKTRTERIKSQQREFDAQKQYRDHIQVFIDRFRFNANRASQVQSKLKLLEKLPELVPVEKESEVVLRFPETEVLSPPILQLDELYFYYVEDKPLFLNVCLNANMESRICIVGENGAGKTTLLKILMGDLSPVKGLRHAHRSLRIGYFSQHHVDQLDMSQNSVEVLASRLPGHPSEYYRSKLGSFGVSGELALRPVASLSGGQKSRVAFAAMILNNPNFFILDEPTNHLDMETIEALGNALNKFKGGVILVSHDERLIRVVCRELWVCGDQRVYSLEGGIDEYKKLVQQELAAQK